MKKRVLIEINMKKRILTDKEKGCGWRWKKINLKREKSWKKGARTHQWRWEEINEDERRFIEDMNGDESRLTWGKKSPNTQENEKNDVRGVLRGQHVIFLKKLRYLACGIASMESRRMFTLHKLHFRIFNTIQNYFWITAKHWKFCF